MAMSSRAQKTEMIDRALAGQSAEVKARVLAIIIRYNIDVRNEFFLIFVAIGHLLAIVEEAPENWRKLFDGFSLRLDEWSEQNLKTLAAIHQQGEAAERMSQSFLKLTDSLKLSSAKTNELQSDLIALSKTLQGLTSSLAQVSSESRALSKRFTQTEQFIQSSQNRREWTLIANYVMTALLVMATAGLFWQQMKQGQRIGWMLEKANRQECFLGVKAADDPQCWQYQ